MFPQTKTVSNSLSAPFKRKTLSSLIALLISDNDNKRQQFLPLPANYLKHPSKGLNVHATLTNKDPQNAVFPLIKHPDFPFSLLVYRDGLDIF